MRSRPLAFGLAAAFFCAGPAWAQSGRLAEKLQLCSACHGEDGNSKIEKIPSLAGQPAFFILNQLFLMREGVRKVEAMAPIVKDLKDEDLTNLSEHFAKLPAKRSDEAIDPALAKQGRRDRHAAALRLLPSAEAWPVSEQMPRVAGQRIDYLIERLKSLPRHDRGPVRDTRHERADLAGRDATPTLVGARALRRVACSSPGRQSQNAKVRVSMLSRGGALGGVLGSSNAECAVNFVGTV